LGGILTFLIIGFSRGWIWTQGQVERLATRYDKHLERTVDFYKDALRDSREREKEWHGVANTALETNREFAGQLEAVVESQRTLISIVTAARDLAGRTGL
jgi:hypothetical protein